jgi:single-strand DNA-binding protein
MSEAKIEGIIKRIMNEVVISDKFKKRELVIATQSEYPQNIMVEFHQDNCAILNQYAEGELVNVSVNIRGREWINPQGEAKYFNTLQAWRIERIIEESGNAIRPIGNIESNFQEDAIQQMNNDMQDDDDLPF